ncbi:TetR/AcrR family transcriptional regulator [Streptomyces sp. NPDC002454]|uniref:TetR/AcrR family transcriptional regulator n=1 Tax=Streptomyces sp. NPDC002490 TaxID=3154416 RepID=UPI00331BCD10
MARRHDPGRRQRIVDAAIRVIGARGVEGLSHRTVAAEADVPLGSTTYHFATLDELLVAALRQVNRSTADLFDQALSATGSEDELAAGIAALMGRWLHRERTGVEREYELYLAALRKPGLRPVAAEWTEHVTGRLAERTDPDTARAVSALVDGLFLQVLLTEVPYDEAYAREMLRRLLRG